MKLSALLAVTDQLKSSFKNMVKDYQKFFSASQGAFIGETSYYVAEPDTIDEPNRRYNRLVQTTVDEKMDWFKEQSTKFIDALFSMEATNASGIARATLNFRGRTIEMSSLELLRLKSLLESAEYGDLGKMFETIPVYSDAVPWVRSTNEQYEGRAIYETPEQTLVNKTTKKEAYIVHDPHADKSRQPITATRDTAVLLGTQTVQHFSGQWSQRMRANLLKHRAELLTAVTEALKEANDIEAVKSNLTANMLFDMLDG